MEPTPAVHTLGITSVLSESLRIIKLNYSHFVALSLFFLPLSFSFIITPTLNHFHKYPSNHHQTLLIPYLLYALTVYALSLCAIATITYSTYHSFFGEQVNFLTSLKSLTNSFFPILSTAVVANVLLLTSLQSLGGFVFVDYSSTKFIYFSVILCMFLLYIFVNWSLAFVVAVVESKWASASLTRSVYLVKGMRLVLFKLMLIYGVLGGMIVFVYSRSLLGYGLMTGSGVFNTLFGSSFLMMFLMQSTVANVVLYNYSRALNGELAIEVDAGFLNE